MKSEITIITDMARHHKKDDVIDDLILALAHCGYAPYITDEDNICFTVDNGESVNQLKETE